MKTTNALKTQEKVIRYFEESGMDYGAWSRSFNMHFGYYKAGLNPFKREQLLDQLNQEVLDRLQLCKEEPARVLDLGCGLGATARYIARRHPMAFIRGLTITPWQVEYGNELSRKENLAGRVILKEANFCDMPVASNGVEAAYALESACYASGDAKEALIWELARVLNPAGRFEIANGIRKHSRPLPNWLEGIYRRNLKCWALDELSDIEAMKTMLRKAGFKKVRVEEISWRVAPSFMHIPFVTIQFLWRYWRKNGHLNLSTERWNNVKAPLFGMLMGLSRKHFGYYIISGHKASNSF